MKLVSLSVEQVHPAFQAEHLAVAVERTLARLDRHPAVVVEDDVALRQVEEDRLRFGGFLGCHVGRDGKGVAALVDALETRIEHREIASGFRLEAGDADAKIALAKVELRPHDDKDDEADGERGQNDLENRDEGRIAAAPGQSRRLLIRARDGRLSARSLVSVSGRRAQRFLPMGSPPMIEHVRRHPRAGSRARSECQPADCRRRPRKGW